MILKSGKEIQITLAPFSVSKELWKSVLEEAKFLRVHEDTEIDINLIKDIFCTAFSSKKIDDCLKECLKRVTYCGLKIDENTFEAEEARGDYLEICFEVAKANITPFTKNLYALYAPLLEKLKSSPA